MTFDSADLVVAVLGAALGWLAAARSYRLDAASAAADWLRGLRSWASESIDVLADAAYRSPKGDAEQTSEQRDALKQSRTRLSALTDRGRLFLPSTEDNTGAEKPPAYRGYRHAALDALVAAEKVLGGELELYDFPDRKSALIGLRREFVSILQAMLDPRSTNRQVLRWLRQSVQERSDARRVDGRGLLSDADTTPPGEKRLMRLASARFVLEDGLRKSGALNLKGSTGL